MRIDLNCDLGEGVGDDEALLAIVSSANVATGAHAGGGGVLRATVASAVGHGVAVGAHPAYPDRAGFGRRSLLAELADAQARARLLADLVHQVLRVGLEAERRGEPLAHVKPHGALYNDAVADVRAALLVAEAVAEVGRRCGYPVPVMTQPHGALAARAGGFGVPVVAEGFVDRAYRPDGSLVPRDETGAVHHSIAAMVDQSLAMADGRLPRDRPEGLGLGITTLCVHGDTEGAVLAARAVRDALESAGWRVRAPVPPSASYHRIVRRLRSSAVDDAGGPVAEVVPFGDRAVLVRPRGDAIAPPGWVAWMAQVARRAGPGLTVVPGLGSVLVAGAAPTGRVETARVEAAVLAAGLGGEPGADGDVGRSAGSHELATVYDGPDLADVAAAAGIPVAELVARHTAATWTVAAVGFAPGFGYLTGDDPLFAGIARRADPRRRVPAGSVALAAGMCAVYPSTGPGGWQLIGRTDRRLFDPDAVPPGLLAVGDRVRFTAVP